ncbi:MAG: DUF5678 domain-containing protein [Acidobacteriota bacterium]|jgi:TRAP-type C4-dicarboxylate transport system substrate-binding protein|nr:DUF5678 domain-containing protein [Acidobacteriota bacterium]
MPSVNEVVRAFNSLPKVEQEKVLEILVEGEQQNTKNKEVQEQVARFKKAEKWLKENRDEYLGQWVCLYGDKLIANGEDGRKVFQQAKEKGIESPYLVRVIEEPEAFCGAWL